MSSYNSIINNFRIDSNGIIKVADFGLSEDVYVKNYFRQWGKDDGNKTIVKLPVKWMALESLHDGLFSEKTDVVSIIFFYQINFPTTQWSYGVLCWEVFSLGKIPYPGLDPISVIELLDSGGRLLCPSNAACSKEM